MKMQEELFIEQIESYSARGEWNQVIAACEAGIQGEEVRKVYPLLAKAYACRGKLDRAIATYQKMLDAQLESAEVHGELGLLYSRKRQLEEAVGHYQQALSLKPDWVQLQFNLAVVFHQLENWNLAVAAYEKTTELDPNCAAAYFNLGLVYQRQNNLAAAVENYRRAIALQPERVRNYVNLGKVLARQRKTAEAIAAFNAGLQRDPTQASLHHALGLTYWSDGQLELAASSLEYALTVAPELAEVHRDLGKLWQQQGDYVAAIACWRRAIELEPDNVSAYNYCAEVLQQVGRLSEAIDCWQRVVSLQPAFVRAYVRQGIALEPHDLLSRAKSCCARFLAVLEQKSNYSEIYYYLWQTYRHLGDIWFERGASERAAIYYRQALEIATKESELYLRLGNCLARQERLDAAIAVYRAGLTIEGNRRELWVELSKVMRRKSSLQLFPVDKNLAWLPQKVYHHTQDWVRDCQLANFDYTTVAWEETTSQPKITGKRHPEPIASWFSSEAIPANWLVSTSSTIDEGKLEKQTADLLSQLSPSRPMPKAQFKTLEEKLPTVFEEASSSPLIRDSQLTSARSRDVIYEEHNYKSELFDYFTGKKLVANTYQCSFNRSVPIKPLAPFVVTIPQGRIWIAPQNSSQIGNGLAVITPDGYLLKDLSSNYPWCLPRVSSTEIPPAAEIEGKVAILTGAAANDYAGWMLDVLPRIELIRRSGIELDSIDWFVVNKSELPFQQETLALLEIPPIEILSSDRYPQIVATELIVPSFPQYLDWVSAATIEFLRETFLAQTNSPEAEPPERIYLSPRNTPDGKLINEAEVISLLSQYGFQTVFLEAMSVSERVSLFAQAKAIVAPHGSGLANLAFCEPQTTVIELFSPNYLRTDYWAISKHLRLNHCYLIGDRFDCDFLRNLMYQSPAAEDILVDLKSLESILTMLLG